MEGPNLDGRRFEAISNDGGEVDGGTRFEFHERPDGTVWARYEGGAIRLGFLVGVREGHDLFIRYVHVGPDGTTASGHSTDRLEELPDGRVRIHETWAWDSRPGSGTSVLEETPDA